MNEFPPPRQRGLVIHIALVIFLSLLSGLALWLTLNRAVGLVFSLYLLLFLISTVFIPIFGYRAYALLRANYLLDRNVLRLVWGLRVQEIPVTDVEWVRPVKGLTEPVRLPWLKLPGGILGVTQQPDLGRVEFLASETENLTLVATAHEVYAISPEDLNGFLQAFQKTLEMGSLQTSPGISQYPSFILLRAWHSRLVRYLWLAGILLNTGLMVWITSLIPSLGKVTLGFDQIGRALEPVPGAQLLLLPFLSSFLFIIGLVSGLFFYRKQEHQYLAVAVWISSVVTAFFFLLSLIFILSTPV